jgi:acyl-CoA reductase-like NAD-dependent aldehyde dehydrogenase
MKLTLANFIDGDFLAPATGSYIDSFNPATGALDHLVPDSGPADIDRAVQAAKLAFRDWSKTTVEERSRLLNRVADICEERKQELAEAESRDQGKPVSLALSMDIPRVIKNLRYFASAIIHRHESMTRMDEGALNYTVKRPVGVAGLISPWNLPLYVLTWKIAPAIAAGNTVVAKPSEMTSLTAWMFASILNEAGVPDGVVNFVFGRGPSAGQALVEHPDVPIISFTGGTVTGRAIAGAAAPRLKRLSLELGGKNPNIIFDDADIVEASRMGVRAAFLNQGEICLCGSRVYVQEKVYAEFTERFARQAAELRVGDPRDPKTFMGPVVSKAHQEKILSYIEIAKKDGGRFLMGEEQPKMPGEFANGYWVHPTSNDSRVCREEIFGPVVTIAPFKTEEEAIELANDLPYGLSASVWTKDISRAHRLGEQLHAGTIWVNTWMLRDVRVPFGGMKESGVGREGGEHSLDFFSDIKNVCVKF